MPKIPIFTAKVNKNVDAIALDGSTSEINDGFLDEAGYVNRRPGLVTFSTISGAGGIDGLFYWDEKQVTIAVSGGTIYSINSAGTATSIGTGLLSGTRVTFATAKISGSQVLAMANGNGVYTTDGVTVSNQAAAPADSTHVAFIDRYLLSNNPGTGNLEWSDLNDPTTWNALNFTEAERKPDDLIAVHVQGRDVVLFGFRSIEFYYDDGSSPFRRFEGGDVENGVSAAYSIQYVPEINSWLYLDENRHLTRLSGRQTQRVSSPFDKELQALSVANDALSDIIRVDGRGFYVITFPDDNKTFVYDYRLDAWYRWGNWNTSTPAYDRFIGNVSTYDTRDKRHLVGHKDNGKIYDMRSSIYQDDGNEIRTNLRTGYIEHGTLNSKRSTRLQFRLKRGVAKDASDTAGEIQIKYRDEDERDFSTERVISTEKVVKAILGELWTIMAAIGLVSGILFLLIILLLL